MKTVHHGGARRNAGRPAKPGWKTCGFRLDEEVRARIKKVARLRKMSQSELVNELLKYALL